MVTTDGTTESGSLIDEIVREGARQRTGRLHRDADQRWRREDAIQAGHRTLAEVDRMSGTEFEDHGAALCRRDGCTDVRRVGGAGDNGADVLGHLPDGRTLIVQCKRYSTKRTIAARDLRDLRDLLGSKAHFGADLAVCVTTTRLSRPSLGFAVQNRILAIHRDSLGLWNNGATLHSLPSVNGAGQVRLCTRTSWWRCSPAHVRKNFAPLPGTTST
jgi:restriction system protein